MEVKTKNKAPRTKISAVAIPRSELNSFDVIEVITMHGIVMFISKDTKYLSALEGIMLVLPAAKPTAIIKKIDKTLVIIVVIKTL